MLDPKKVYERFGKARATAQLWLNLLQHAYNLSMPNRSEFSIQKYMPGAQRNLHVYDATAVVGLKKFAANMQNLLLPSGQHWAHLKPGTLVEEGKAPVGEHEAREQCEKWQKLFFEKLSNSNFQNASYQTLMEMGISTGILLLNEGTPEDPFHFTSVPLHQVALEPGKNDDVQNVYRHMRVQAQTIPLNWPKAKIDEALRRQIDGDPSSEIEIVEGTVFDPEAPADKAWAYFVMTKEARDFMFIEYRSYSPWIAFRWDVYAGEVLGRGPIIDTLPFIKDLNKLAEFDLRAASFNANPIFLDATGGGINPYTARIEPGAIIPVQPNGVTQNPIQQLQITGTPTYAQLTRSELVASVNNALNVNPVVPENQTEKTATEVNARMSEWARENQSSAGRFVQEVNAAIFDKCWRILHRFGLVPIPKIDGKHLKVEFSSPIKDMQGIKEIDKLVQYSQYSQQILGQQYAEYGVMYGLDIKEVPAFIAKQLDISVDVTRDALGKQQFQQNAQSALQNQNNGQNPLFQQQTAIPNANAGPAAPPQSQ